MALTISNVDSRSDDVWGRHKVRIVSVTFDSSYATGGESLTPNNVGLAQFDIVIPSVDANAEGGHVVQYDYTAQTLMVFVEESTAAGGPLLEAASATDLDGLVVRVLCVGN